VIGFDLFLLLHFSFQDDRLIVIDWIVFYRLFLQAGVLKLQLVQVLV
jgi:hypothetical protein